MDRGLRHYLVVTGGYWAFTITDGAIRMLVVLYFHQLGYSPLEIASLFLFYEFFGIVTNLVGGWLGSRIGLNRTMHIGMSLQIVALLLLTVDDSLLTVVWVMAAQALSGIAKDLNKMSAKASVKLLVPGSDQDDQLFRWIAALTGSKNSLKGAGFFIGGALLQWIGFRGALYTLAGILFVVGVATILLLPGSIGKLANKPKFRTMFARTSAINWLSGARFFLFGARDVWFVVALPVFLSTQPGWSYSEVGGFLAAWIISYGVIQAVSPGLLSRFSGGAPSGATAMVLVAILGTVPGVMAWLLATQSVPAIQVVLVGLALFGILFALNSALHSYLVVAWSDHDNVSGNVGFYYMANAGGRLVGTVISGLSYQQYGLSGSLWCSMVFLLLAAMVSIKLPRGVVINT